MSTWRPVELGRGLWGIALLTAPVPVMHRLDHVRLDPMGAAVARVLGGRQLAQALLSGASPSPEVLAMGVWVDGAHALTTAGLAAVDRSRARAGLTDAAVALTWAVVGWRDLATPQWQAPAHDRRRDRLAAAVLRVVPGGAALLGRAGRAGSGALRGGSAPAGVRLRSDPGR